ncbi:MAG: lysophospholipid acyltransferase family protein [Calditrichia bacterium]
MISMVRTLFFLIMLVLDTIAGTLFAMMVGLFNPYSSLNSWGMKVWAKILVWSAGVRSEIFGLERIRPGESYILVANHQSHMDIPVLVASLPLPIRIISKKELFKIPVFGWGMRAVGILEIDRSDRKKAFETLQKAEGIVREHHLSILAFPEGTRSPDGKIHPFKKGPFILAINTGLPLLPISVSGTCNILPKKKLRIRGGRVKIQIHPPITTTDKSLDDRNELVKQTHEAITAGFIENYH